MLYFPEPLTLSRKGIWKCPPDSPMLRVTVMILRDIVESVMLLKDDDWKRQ